ncbi:MAG: hypothetical protein EBZ01_04215, partial [Betaproteobacteria bacterium]|nr:hypothetical protein [Betaproteobacteria bacterium]
LDSSRFEQILITGYCDDTEADYLDEVATDITATRIAGLGRSVSPIADLKAFFGLVRTIKTLQPDVIHTHTAKAGALGRLASIIAGRGAVRIHTFHGHLLHGYFAGWKTKLVVLVEKFFAKRTHHLIAIGTEVERELLAAGIGKASQYSVFFPGLPEPHTASKAEIRRKLELDPSAIYCTFVGRLTHIKRPDRLLDIAAAMVKREVPIQFLVAVAGKVMIHVNNGHEKTNYHLDSPRKGLILETVDWHTMDDFSKDCVLLVLASEPYDVNDYIDKPYPES